MRIERLDWDDSNVDHIARHHVNPEEVEDVCFGDYIYTADSVNRYILSGQTLSGRYLNVVIEKIGKGVFRPVTAFDMSVKYRRAFLRAIGRG